MQAFNVYLGSKLIDTVFYSDGVSVDKQEVEKSLIEHDCYDPNIHVHKSLGRMRTWALTWAPEGKPIGTVKARTARAARRKAPLPYRKYLGEIGVEEVAP